MGNKEPIRIFGNLEWENIEGSRFVFFYHKKEERSLFALFTKPPTDEFEIGVDPFSQFEGE